MQHLLFGADTSRLSTAVLIKDSSFNKSLLMANYIRPLIAAGIDSDTLMASSLPYKTPKKAPASFRKEQLATLLPYLDTAGVKTLLVCDGEYFKTLTKNTKTDPHYGYVLDCAIEGYEHMKVALGMNYQAVLYNPNLQLKLDLSLKTLITHLLGNYVDPGSSIIHRAEYPHDVTGIKEALRKLAYRPVLTCDIETYGLKFYSCGIASIAFAWNQHNGTAFAVDSSPHSQEIRALLKEFFEDYTGTLIFHNAAFDIKVLVYNLWMKDLSDYAGMIQGIETLTRKFEDTKLIAYLATNNTVKNDLKLKNLAQAFAGNYAQESIADVASIPLSQLLAYNLVDCLSTWYVLNKYSPLMWEWDQYNLYLDFFLPCVKTILQMELTGMPIDPNKVAEARATLEKIVGDHQDYLQNSPIIKDYHYQQLEERVNADNLKLKTKVRTIEEFSDVQFNPGSDKQLQGLIYEYLGYEVIDTTDAGQPATGGKTLEKLINHAKSDEHKEIFENLIGLSKADKVLTSFIPAFEQAQQLPDGSYRLYGNFNLGGTQSGRLSSSDPNLQNIPSDSDYSRIVKVCFVSPPGWLFCGADFKALEAVCEALLSKDPNKLKVYIEGYDSHCVNAFAYFGDQMPDIVNTVESINSIADKYKPLRSKSKAPTFAFTYQGTWRTIMRSTGLSEEVSKKLEHNYHNLYKVSDAWIKGILDTAHTTGYVTGAFGLKIRTPILAQTLVTTTKMPYMAKAERRSAGNAVTQSYGMLNSRAGMAFQKRVLASPYRLDILPVAQIHDAIYLLVRDEPKIVKWVNDNLVDCMRWQELPELQHDIVKLGANLDVYWPDWSTALTLPNDVPVEDIRALALAHKQKNRPSKEIFQRLVLTGKVDTGHGVYKCNKGNRIGSISAAA